MARAGPAARQGAKEASGVKKVKNVNEVKIKKVKNKKSKKKYDQSPECEKSIYPMLL
jgi:hypothetical protein